MMKAGRLLHDGRTDKSISKADGITSLEELYLYYFKIEETVLHRIVQCCKYAAPAAESEVT